MIDAFDPASYPGPRPSGPVLVFRGEVHPLHVDGPASRPLRLAAARTPAADSAVLRDPQQVRWSVAYGSNASPGRLVSKGLDRDGALLVPARMLDHVAAFEHRRTGYGSVPVTLVPAPGATVDVWVLGLPPSSVDHLDRTEGRVATGAPDDALAQPEDPDLAPPGTYQLADIGEVAVAERFVLPGALAYRPGPATRVQVDEQGAWRTWPRVDQRSAAAHVERSGPDRPPPPVTDPHLGPWPDTPFTDPPLFVYGTLLPDEVAHLLVADLVEVAGEASVAGRLYDTGHGYPAAAIDPEVRVDMDVDAHEPARIHGVLLAPRDADRAAELVRRCDAYGGLPPYGRVLVRAVTGDGARWAMTYRWAVGQPPGTPSPAGRWAR